MNTSLQYYSQKILLLEIKPVYDTVIVHVVAS